MLSDSEAVSTVAWSAAASSESAAAVIRAYRASSVSSLPAVPFPAFTDALISGILCNTLVCLAVWLAMGARTTTDKVLAIVFPITAFVAAGFEHCVANMYFIPFAWLIKTLGPAELWVKLGTTAADYAALTPAGFVSNVIPATIGNIIGGGVLVGAMYWFVYLRMRPR